MNSRAVLRIITELGARVLRELRASRCGVRDDWRSVFGVLRRDAKQKSPAWPGSCRRSAMTVAQDVAGV